jgi:hypothetical protein
MLIESNSSGTSDVVAVDVFIVAVRENDRFSKRKRACEDLQTGIVGDGYTTNRLDLVHSRMDEWDECCSLVTRPPLSTSSHAICPAIICFAPKISVSFPFCERGGTKRIIRGNDGRVARLFWYIFLRRQKL